MTEAANIDTTIKHIPDYAEPLLKFLHQTWWRVESSGFNHLPDEGPALIAGNTSGYIPWPALMLIYRHAHGKNRNRPLYTLIDNHYFENEKISAYLTDLNFRPWSYDNAKQLLEKDELVAIFPEDISVMGKTIASRNRLKRFDWTKFLPAIELHVPIFPLAVLGVDESNLVLHNSQMLSRLLETKVFPVSPFFPWLPFPLNLFTLPIAWQMKVLTPVKYEFAQERAVIQEQAKKVALRAEGEIQAEINRLLRNR